MENGIVCDHCWHDEPYILTSMPPQQPQVCCHCGEHRILPNPYKEISMNGHGKYIPMPEIGWWTGDPTCGGIAENYQPKRDE